jgi:hypothetical protein
MNEQQQPNNRNGASPLISAASISHWLNKIFDLITRAVTGDDRAGGTAPIGRSSAPQGGLVSHAAPRRSLVGYLNTGLYKVEQARRLSAMNRQYGNALHTIDLTRKAIKRAPRRSRNLFAGYNHVLSDAKHRVKNIYAQMRHTEVHLRRYNPHELDEEIRRLERTLAAATSPTSRAEIELILEARRDMLESLIMLDEKLTALGTQLGTIAAALELNHVRVIGITSRTGYSAETDILHARMREVTEQLTLLEESLRELDAG